MCRPVRMVGDKPRPYAGNRVVRRFRRAGLSSDLPKMAGSKTDPPH